MQNIRTENVCATKRSPIVNFSNIPTPYLQQGLFDSTLFTKFLTCLGAYINTVSLKAINLTKTCFILEKKMFEKVTS